MGAERHIGFLRVVLRRGTLGKTSGMKETVKALGFGPKGLLNSEVVHENNSTIRGMVHKIRHMVEVEPIWVATEGPELDIAQRRLHGHSARGSSKTVGIEEYVHAFPVLRGEPTLLEAAPAGLRSVAEDAARSAGRTLR